MTEDNLKYPNLRKRFPQELIDECIAEAQKSPEHFKEWFLIQCHQYAVELLQLYYEMTMNSQLRVATAISDLQRFEEMQKQVSKKPQED